MEILGTVIKIESNYVRLRTMKKKQEIDVFFNEKKYVAIEAWLEPNMSCIIEVESESIEFFAMKLAKLWFRFAISPEPQTEIFIHSEQLRKRKNLLLTLFKKDFNPNQ